MPGQAKVRVAFKGGTATDAILTLRYERTLLYKYGCGDPRFRNLGGTVSLLWQAITEAKAEGATGVDLGRSDASNDGLIRFKDRWGASRAPLVYYRCPPRARAHARPLVPAPVATLLFASAPDAMLRLAGRVLYRHFA